MANTSGAANTICPFYVREADKSITCEGTIPGTCSQQKFDTRADMLSFQARFCCTKTYTRCPHAAVMTEKYQNDGNPVSNDGNPVIAFPENTTLGQRIAIARRKHGFTQEQLSKATHISRSCIGDFEAGRYKPSISALIEIGNALHMDAAGFIAGMEDV